MMNRYNFNLSYDTIVWRDVATWPFSFQKGAVSFHISGIVKVLSKPIIHN